MQTKSLILLSVLLGCSTTSGRPQGEITGNEIEPANGEETIDFGAAYKQFFKIKDIIDRISLKNFKGRFDDIPAPKEAPAIEDVAVVEPEAVTEVAYAAITEAAAPATTEAAIEEVTEVATEAAIVVVTEAAIEVVTEAAIEVVTEAAVEVVTEAVTEAAIEVATEAATEDVEVVPRIVNEIDDVPVDESEESFFISDDTAEAAKKYGYKILLKKVNGKTIPVGKINIAFPTVIEIVHQADEATTAASAIEETTAAADVEETTAAAADVEETTAVVVPETLEEIIEEVMPIVEEISEEDVTTIIPEDVVTAVIPEAVEVSVESIADGVAKIAENAEMAIDSMKERSDENTSGLACCSRSYGWGWICRPYNHCNNYNNYK